MAKPKGHGGGGGHERWLVSYADFITLLTVLFIVLYSFAKADLEKYKNLSVAAKKAFNIPVFEGKDNTAVNGQGSNQGPVTNIEDLSVVQTSVSNMAQAIGMEQNVSVGPTQEGLAISLSGNVIFGSGSADVTPQGKIVLDRVAEILKDAPGQLRIEGHTDNVPPTGNTLYPNNFELSGARAKAVLEYFTQVKKIDPARLSFAGFGEFRPVADNATREGRERNRRVDIIVVRPEDLLRSVGTPQAASPSTPAAGAPASSPASSQSDHAAESPAKPAEAH